MNVLQSVSTLMTTDLITVHPSDTLTVVKEKFKQHNIHHIPVVKHLEIVGIISMTDFLYFLHGFEHVTAHKPMEDPRLEEWKAKDIMTHQLAKVDVNDPIRTALEVFKLNKIHAIPVLEDEKLVGIITTHDIIAALADEPVELKDYSEVNS